jgi:hypothetical protein
MSHVQNGPSKRLINKDLYFVHTDFAHFVRIYICINLQKKHTSLTPSSVSQLVESCYGPLLFFRRVISSFVLIENLMKG